MRKRSISLVMSVAMIVTSLMPGNWTQTAKAAETKAASPLVALNRNPIISGNTNIQLQLGDTFGEANPLTRIYATDLEDGDLTSRIVKGGDTVNTGAAGTYTVQYSVTDSDQNQTTMTQTVVVGNFSTPLYQKTLYTMGKNLALVEGNSVDFNRSYYHDRQDLGIYMPTGSSLSIRIVNSEQYNANLELDLLNDDSQTEAKYAIKSNGETLTVTSGANSIPFIRTPKGQAVQPIVEYSFSGGARQVTSYHYGDDQAAFFAKWRQNQDAFAVIEGSAATMLVPFGDIDKVVNDPAVSRAEYRFSTIDSLLDFYQQLLDQYDEYSGLDYHAEDPINQNIRSKYFLKANKHGFGLAYYTQDHSAYNAGVMQAGNEGYFCKSWVILHELGHGYEGKLAAQELALVETTNNIPAYYYEQTYLAEGDAGWLGRRTNIEKVAATNRASAQYQSFNDIANTSVHFQTTLYMFVNLLDKIGPEKGTSALHTNFRATTYNNNGKSPSSSDALIEYLGEAGNYNLVPYFDSYHIQPSDALKEKVFDQDYPFVYYLRDLVDSDATAETIRQSLNLKGLYDLVTVDDLKSTGHKSNVTIHINIDDLAQIRGKDLIVKNGSEIVKKVEINSENVSLGELPIGLYELELPNTISGNYQFDYETITASMGSVVKEVTYGSNQKSLADDLEILFKGLGDNLFASAKYDSKAGNIQFRINPNQPHALFSENYATFTVLNLQGEEVYSKNFAGDVHQTAETVTIPVQEGYRLKIFHKEKDRLQFYSNHLGSNETSLQMTTSNTGYIITKYGFMKYEWSAAEQMSRYKDRIRQMIEAFKATVTEDEFNNKNAKILTKVLLASAIELLDEAGRNEFLTVYPDFFKGSKPKFTTLQSEFQVGDREDFSQIFSVMDLEDGNVLNTVRFVSNAPKDANGCYVAEGIYKVSYAVTDKDLNEVFGQIQLLIYKENKLESVEIPASFLTAAAPSEETSSENGRAANVVDGNDNTIWHTNYSGGVRPNFTTHTNDYITIDLGATYQINQMSYTPRKTGDNGTITQYQLFYSIREEGDDFIAVPGGSGSWVKNNETKTVSFDPIQARRIRLQALAAHGNFISAAEIKVYEHRHTITTDCTCSLAGLSVPDQVVEIPYGIGSTVVELIPSIQLQGDCSIYGHTEDAIHYTYEIVDDVHNNAFLTDNRLLIHGYGNVRIKTTAVMSNRKAISYTTITANQIVSSQLLVGTYSGTAESEHNSTPQYDTDGNAVPRDGCAAEATDGNTETYWHSNYANNSKKPDIANNVRNGYTIELQDAKQIYRLDYLPRENSVNGRILEYKLYYSTEADPDTFIEIPDGSGVWTNNSSWKIAQFTPIHAKKIQIRATKTAGTTEDTFITAKEFYLYELLQQSPDSLPAQNQTTVQFQGGPGATGLAPANQTGAEGSTVILPANTFSREGFVFGGWQNGSYNYQPGEGCVLSGSTMTFIAQWNEIIPEINKTVLQSTYDQYKNMTQGDYSDETWSRFQTAVSNAERILSDDSMTQEQVDNANTELIAAHGQLQTKPVVPTVDKTNLQNKYNEYKDMVQGNYSSASWNVFTTARSNAAAALGNDAMSQEQINSAYSDLVIAFGQLAVESTTPTVNKLGLQSKYNEYKNVTQGRYTDESWNTFNTARINALAVLGDSTMTQAQVDYAYSSLVRAYQGLELKPEDPTVTVDKTLLQSKYNEYKDIIKGNYTDATWNVFTSALTNALQLLNNSNVTQAQVDNACTTLTNAFTNLKLSDGEQGTTPPVVVPPVVIPPVVVPETPDEQAASYKVTFDPAGGTVDLTEKEVSGDTAIGSLPTPVRTNAIFQGWFTELTGGTQVTAATVITNHITVYAHWANSGSSDSEPVKKIWIAVAKSDSLKVKWTKVKKAKKYKVYIYQSDTKKWTLKKTTTKLTSTIKKLDSNKTYRIRVRAYNAKGKVLVKRTISASTI